MQMPRTQSQRFRFSISGGAGNLHFNKHSMEFLCLFTFQNHNSKGRNSQYKETTFSTQLRFFYLGHKAPLAISQLIQDIAEFSQYY